MKIGAVIVGAGRGERLGTTLPKAFVLLAHQPLYEHSLKVFASHPEIDEVVFVVPASVRCLAPNCKVVEGGASRQESVYNGLLALNPEIEAVLVHDAARPLITKEVLDRLILKIKEGKNAIVAIPVADTIKAVEGNTILKTVDRANLWAAQTPQGFKVSILKEAYKKANQEGWLATDEASLAERLGMAVEVVLGDPLNFKITTPQDLKIAESLLNKNPQ